MVGHVEVLQAIGMFWRSRQHFSVPIGWSPGEVDLVDSVGREDVAAFPGASSASWQILLYSTRMSSARGLVLPG